MTEEDYWKKVIADNKLRNPHRQKAIFDRLKQFLGREMGVNNASVFESTPVSVAEGKS